MRATCVFLLLAAVAMSACGDDEDTASESQDSRNSVEETSANQESAGRSPKGVVATVEVEQTEYELNPSNPGVEDPGKVACPIADHAQQGMSGSVSIAYDKVNETDQPREEGEQGPGSDGHGGY